ncbi:hypothetical protein ACFLVB_01575 [Chloroflexota bacterium]
MTSTNINFQANCNTTAMAIMPHTDIKRVLDIIFQLDIPFWPQLPHIAFHEDAYVQTSQNFPGINIDGTTEKMDFSIDRFEKELDDYSQKMIDPETYVLSDDYSVVYSDFLKKDLGKYLAIHGQVTGPVSFGFRVTDTDSRPIIYNTEVRTLLYDFIQRKINLQYQQLREKNRNAFVWMDEPGLGWVFSGLSGYNDVQARRDYQNFLEGIEGPGALHLCANVNLPYLLELGVDLLSFDAYQIDIMPKGYTDSIAKFISNGGVISWGIVPTDSDGLSRETPEALAHRLSGYWEVVSRNTNMSVKQIAGQSLLAPASCSLKNIGQVGAADDVADHKTRGKPDLTIEETMVETAFAYLGELSEILKDRFNF